MNRELGGFSIEIDGLDFKNRLKSRRQVTDAKLAMRLVLQENDREPSVPQIAFKELRILSRRGVLSDIYMISKEGDVEIENVGKLQMKIHLPTYQTRLSITSDEAVKIEFLLSFLQNKNVHQYPGVVANTVSKTENCPLRSDNFINRCSSPTIERNSTRDQEGDKENMSISNLNKVKFSDLSRIESSGNTPKLKKGNTSVLSPSSKRVVPAPMQQSIFRITNDIGISSPPLSRQYHQQQNNSPTKPAAKVCRNLSQETSFQVEVTWNAEQEQLLSRALQGESLFITGGAGSGKSTLLKKIIQECIKQYSADAVYVTATTGLAAFAIGGVTIHQYLSLPVINYDDPKSEEIIKASIQQIVTKKPVVQRCQQTKVLVIDEVSMLDPKLFEILNSILQKARSSRLLFGGIQLIASGDFFQLPPVRGSTGSRLFTQPSLKEGPAVTSRKPRYCFEISLWTDFFRGHSYELRTIHRQSKDSEFLSFLAQLRIGSLSSEALESVNRQCLQRLLPLDLGILPTQIFTHKKDVDLVNERNLAGLKGTAVDFTATDSGEEPFIKQLQSNCPVKTKLSLKVGAQVMLLKTIDPTLGLVNGARGIVLRFMRDTNCPVVKFETGEEQVIFPSEFLMSLGKKVVARRLQIPLDLSWAISVHKAQGITVSAAELHLQNAFEYGQIYVAMSRVKSLQGVSLKSMIPIQKVNCDPIVLAYYRETFGY